MNAAQTSQRLAQMHPQTAPWRGLGLGAAVIRQVEEAVWTNPQIFRLRTAVQVNNPGAIRFWDRMGYIRISGPTLQPDGTTTYLLEESRPHS